MTKYLLIAAAAYYFLMRPKAPTAPATNRAGRAVNVRGATGPRAVVTTDPERQPTPDMGRASISRRYPSARTSTSIRPATRR